MSHHFSGYAGTNPWGDTPPPSTDTGAQQQQFVQMAQQALSIGQSIAAPRDANMTAEVLQAKIENYRAMARKVPALAWWYDNEINKMQGKLRAAGVAQQEQREGAAATRTWRSLGQTGLALGLVTGVVIIVLGVKLARK